MPAVSRRPVSRTGSPGFRPSAVSPAGCSRTMPRRASSAAGRRLAVRVRKRPSGPPRSLSAAGRPAPVLARPPRAAPSDPVDLGVAVPESRRDVAFATAATQNRRGEGAGRAGPVEVLRGGPGWRGGRRTVAGMPSALSTRLRRALPRPRLTRRRLVTGAIVLAVLLGVTGWAAWPTPASYVIENRMITVATGPDGSTKVDLDTTYYKPKAASKDHPVAAVLLAHGFGGTKADVADDAKSLADHGYAVLAWTAEGFGASGGQIHLDSPDWEVRDAQRLIDWLASRPEVRIDAPGDPKVAVVGASYGGGLALMSAAYDRRIDAIVPQITWNDLSNAFLPESTGAGAASGVFKKVWAGLFFGSGASAGAWLTGVGAAAPTGGAPTDGAPDSGAPSSNGAPDSGAPSSNGAPDSGTPPRGGRRASGDPSCGRFATDVCRAYLTIAETGSAGPEQLALLRKSSPASVLDRITAPTLLIQGQADSLFPLSEADANAKGIAAHGTPVRVAWFTGGHDGGAGPQSDQDRLHFLTAQWVEPHLLRQGGTPAHRFNDSRIAW